MEEATTSESAKEGTHEVSEAVDETAQGDEGTKESEKETKVSEPEIPEEIKSEFEKLPPHKRDLYNREFKRYLTKHAQKSAEERKRYEETYSKDLEQRLESKHKDFYSNVEKKISELLEDPEKYEALRKYVGIQDKEPEQEEKPIETAEDLVSSYEKLKEEIRTLKEGIPGKVSELSQKEIRIVESNQRYKSAYDKLSSEDKVFKKYAPLIVEQMRKDPDILKGFTYDHNNPDEYGGLKIARENFYNKYLKDEVDNTKQEILDSLKKKQNTSTLPPKKAISTKTGYPVDRRDRIIQKWMSRSG